MRRVAELTRDWRIRTLLPAVFVNDTRDATGAPVEQAPEALAGHRPEPPQRREIDLARTVRDLEPMVAPRFRRQGVELDIHADRLPSLPLDAAMMDQLIVNLLTNGLQAGRRGGKVRLFLTSFPHHAGVALMVSDDGCGIAHEPGLAICRQIVKHHGGTIDVESREGKGTRVIVLLPESRVEQMDESHRFSAVG